MIGTVRKGFARTHVKAQLSARILLEQAGNLDPPYVVLLRVVGTGLHHEHAVAGLEVPNGGGPRGGGNREEGGWL